VAKSVYERLKDLEGFIPQLDAAATENAQELLRMIGTVANSHNELIRRLQEKGVKGFDDLIINI
jgi:hypothetical protein